MRHLITSIDCRQPLDLWRFVDFVRLRHVRKGKTRLTFSNFLTQPFFLRVSTIRWDGVRWTVAWDSQSGASAATVVAYGTVPTIVPETRQNSVSAANASQLA